MEPLAVVALAGNIVQFVQFSHALLSGTGEILSSPEGRRSRLIESQDVAEAARQRIQAFILQLNRDEPKPLPTNASQRRNKKPVLLALCEDCRRVADEILSLLDSLRLKGNHGAFSTWQALYRAAQGEWKKDRIKALEDRLHRMSQTINVYVQEHQINQVMRKLDQLQQENDRLESSRSEDILQLRQDLERAVKKAGQQFSSLHEPWTCLPKALASCEDLTIEQKILGALHFPNIDDRYSRIASAHAQTFGWIFNPESTLSADGRPKVNFAEWLRAADEPVYWISGKPGSGKSTLMKYIYNHLKTREILGKWVGKYELVMVGYFFWAAARKTLQKSQEGLLRSILYHILCKRPDQIRVVFADIWETHEKQQRGASGGWGSEFPSLTRMTDVTILLEAFSRLTNISDDSKYKVFFVIDGLDEYEGQPKEIITLVEHMKTSKNLKFCLSSRSWNEFEEVYGKENQWRLYVHELTKNDIAKYVHDKFGQNERLRRLQQNDDRCPDLVQDIVDAAQGVFLWVYIVVGSLLDGLTNDDRILDLERRLNELPTDLDELFERILDNISPFYREQSARILMVAVTAVQNLPLMIYWYIDQGYLAGSSQLECPSEEQISFRLSQMYHRLNALSKGLLEVPRSYSVKDPLLDAYDSSLGIVVDFLHRTVVDYLTLPRIKAKLSRWIGIESNTNIAICNGVLVHVATVSQQQQYYKYSWQIGTLLEVFYTHAFFVTLEEHHQEEELKFLKHMESVLQSVDERTSGGISTHALPNALHTQNYISPRLAPMYFGITKYVRTIDKLSSLRYERRGALQSFLLTKYDAMYLSSFNKEQLIAEYEATLRVLLEKGCLPNEKISDATIWTAYLALIHLPVPGMPALGELDMRELRFPIYKTMLEFGADPHGRFKSSVRGTRTVKEMIQSTLSSEEFDILSHYFKKGWKHRLKFRQN